MSEVSKRFLPFKDAREYCRKLGLRGRTDFEKWSSSAERPPFIPSNPHRFYPEEFQGHPDFLGYSTRSEIRDVVKAAEVKEQESRSAMFTRKYGMEKFLDHVKTHSKDFELEPFAFDSFFSFLLRPRTVNSSKSWAPMALRTSASSHKTVLRLGNPVLREMSYGFFGMQLIGQQNLFFFPKNADIPPNIAISRSFPRKYLPYMVDNEDLNSLLWHFYENSELDSAAGWLPRSVLRPSGPGDVWARSVQHVWEAFYDPLGFSVKFDIDSIGEAYNMTIDGIPILHRTVTWNACCERFVLHCYRSIGGHKVACDVKDTFDFQVAVVRNRDDQNFSGMYLFPKSILAKSRQLRDAQHHLPGRRHMHIFPPWMHNDLTERVRSNNAWKNEWYIDFSDMSAARIRFLEILHEHKSTEK